MDRRIIAVDIDEVLLPHFQDLMTWYNATYGTSLTLADNGSDDLAKWGTETDEQAIRQVQVFFQDKAFLEAQPFAEAKRALLRLQREHELVVVTARDTIIETVTRDWLQEHFAEVFRDIHFTARYSLEGKRRTKTDVLREIGAAYLIDDSPDNILPAVDAGLTGILFGDYPWSRAETMPAGVIRCKDWRAVEDYFDGRDR